MLLTTTRQFVKLGVVFVYPKMDGIQFHLLSPSISLHSSSQLCYRVSGCVCE